MVYHRILNTVELVCLSVLQIVLGWPKSSFRFFCKMLLFGQPDSLHVLTPNSQTDFWFLKQALSRYHPTLPGHLLVFGRLPCICSLAILQSGVRKRQRSCVYTCVYLKLE